MNRIVPCQRQIPKQLKKSLQILRECLVNESIYEKIRKGEKTSQFPSFYREPMNKMSIRIYSKYFRVAHETFNSQREWFWNEKDKEWHEKMRQEDATLDDIAYYRRHQLGRHGKITDETCFDSIQAFEDMAFDHYGELGLSRMDVHASDYYTPGCWIITFEFSYSSYLSDAVDIAVALYETGCPLIIHNAQKILDVLEEKDNVLLTPNTSHDYFCHHDEGSVFPLPYECYLDLDGELTRKQYDEIVSLTKWDPEEPVVIDSPIPINSPAYELIRKEVQSPLCVCEILSSLQRKYDIVYGIQKKKGLYYCYLIEHCEPKISIDDHNRLFPTCNKALLDAIIRYVKVKQNNRVDKKMRNILKSFHSLPSRAQGFRISLLIILMLLF